MSHYADIKASILGAILSLVGVNFLGLAQNFLTAFILGMVGGWTANKILKHIERKRDETNKKI
jgi:uncharacterized membrane protein YeaQ/YmgE (transglycosylase-associated protein family)